MMTHSAFSETVLIIDDEPSVLRLLVKCLERIGYQTDTALGRKGWKKSERPGTV